jgi:guanine deaminase
MLCVRYKRDDVSAFHEPDFLAMRKAIELSNEGVRKGAGGPFGAVVTQNDRPIGSGYNRVRLDCDPTAHAEIVAIRQASAAIGSFALSECTLYTSCLPCPMCLSAALWARIPLCWYANTSQDAQRLGFDDARFYKLFLMPTDEGPIRLLQVPDQALLAAAREVFDQTQALPNFRLY